MERENEMKERCEACQVKSDAQFDCVIQVTVWMMKQIILGSIVNQPGKK